MATQTQPENSTKRRSPLGILKWLIRFLIRSLLIASVSIVIVCLIAWITYVNRASIVNDALSYYVKPFDVSVDAVELWPLGEVKIRNLSASPKGSDAKVAFAAVPEIHLTYDFQHLRDYRQLKSVIIDEPAVTVTQGHLDAFAQVPSGNPSAPFDLASLDLFTESLEIRNGQVKLDLPSLPTLEAKVTLVSPRLTFTDSGLTEFPIEATLENILINQHASIGDASGRLHLSRDLQTFDLTEVKVEHLSTEITPEWFATSSPPTTSDPKADLSGTDPKPNSVEWNLRKFTIGESTVSITGFDGKDGLPAFPDVKFDTSFSGEEFHFSNGEWSSESPVSLTLDNFSMGSGPSQVLSVDRIEISASSLGSLIQEQTIEVVTIDGADVSISDDSLAPFRLESPVATPSSQESASHEQRSWLLRELNLNDGTFLLRDTRFGESLAPEMETRFQANLSELNWGNEGFLSEALQSFRLEQTRIRAPGAEVGAPPILSLSQGKITGRWSDFDSEKAIQSCTIEGASINLTDASLGDWLDLSPSSSEADPAGQPVYKIADLRISDGELVADSSFSSGRVPKIHSDFSLESISVEEAPYSYLLELSDFRLRNHARFREDNEEEDHDQPTDSFSPVAEEDVFKVQEIEVHFTAEGVQRNQEVERVKVSGAVLRVGDGLKSIVDASTLSENEAIQETSNTNTETPEWLLNTVEVTQSQVIFESLVPQVEGLQFAIETSLTDVPLSADGLLAQDTIQKVELAGIEIKDPYDSFITVAFLPTIFVEFSLAGLASQEIEKVDLINPALHVGQGLFWWIDYQRNFRAQNEGASIGMEEGGPANPNPPVPVPETEETPLTEPDWVIKTINANAGKIVIAPTGVPIGMVPFPFNATTNMKDGSIDLTLTIPDEDFVYEFPDYKVDLYGLTGDVQFNVPVQQVDNNLVQTFTLRRAVWKEYEAENLFLTVTFDSDGIYGKLGGDAYEGYVEGQFNFYLNDPGKWDAWLAGTEFNTGPLTEVIVPDNFLMEGSISLSLVAEGRDKTLGETTGEFQTTTAGWFDITKFDQILEELPPEWSNLQEELTRLGLIALKRFDYEQGAGSLYLQGREGELQMRFTGDYGTRELNLHLHDQRNPGLETAGNSAEQTSTPPLPEAAAKPVAANR